MPLSFVIKGITNFYIRLNGKQNKSFIQIRVFAKFNLVIFVG